MKILILEHNLILGERLFAAVRNEGLSLDWTTDVDAAKQILKRGDVSLMILDMSPELSRPARMTLLCDLREIRRTTPLVLIVDNDSDGEQLQQKADLILAHPVNIEQITRGIRMLLTERTDNANRKPIRNEDQRPVNYFA
jgi:DNA-binding response OmpR family regulator